MNVRPPIQTGAHSGRQQNWASSPVGAVDKLPFNAEQGGTARGGGPDIRPRTDGLSANMTFSAHPASPPSCARRTILDMARQDIRCIGLLLYAGLAIPSDSDEHLFQKTLSLLNHGSEVQAFVMLDHLRASLAGRIRAQFLPELRQLHAWLAQAVNAQDRLSAAKALCILNAVVNRSRQAYGPLPEEMAEDVRMLARSSLSLFRDAEQNPQGPLNAASLRGLDDFVFACLRKASHLHSLGLELDLEAADAVARNRVGALGWKAVEHAMDVFWTLARETVDVPLLIRQLRNLSGLELQRVQRLTDLGQFAGGGPGPGERWSLIRRTCQLAMEELSRSPPHFLVVRNALRHVKMLQGLEGVFGKIASRLASVPVHKDYRCGSLDIMPQLLTTRYLLTGMSNAMEQQLRDLVSDSPPCDATMGRYVDLLIRTAANRVAIIQSATLYQAVREQYGVAYDTAADRAWVPVADTVRAKMVTSLEMLPCTGSQDSRLCTLPVERAAKTFAMDRAFYEGAIERRKINVSVRGTDEEGRPVQFTWPGRIARQGDLRLMGGALDALARVARSSAGPLMRLMDLERASAVLKHGLQAMGLDSPFRLADGTVLLPEGDDHLEFEVVRNEDGSFLLVTVHRITCNHSLEGVRPDRTAVTVTMNPLTVSWAEVSFTLRVSPDAQHARVVGLPQFRHRFDVHDIVADSMRLRASPAVHGGAAMSRP